MKMFNIYADACFNISIATLPFITIGMFGNVTIRNISCAVGVIFLLAGIFSVLFRKHLKDPPFRLDEMIGNLLSLPYAFALSSVIMIVFGFNASSGLWVALFLALLSIGMAFIPDKTPADPSGNPNQ